MDRTAPASKQRNEAIDTLGRLFETYVALPKSDAELEMQRQQLQNTIMRLEREKNEVMARVQSTTEDIESHKRAITANLRQHGANLPDYVASHAHNNANYEELRTVHGNIRTARKTIEGLLREIDEIVRFYGTVKVIGYILLAIVFLIAVLVLTGVIPFYPYLGE